MSRSQRFLGGVSLGYISQFVMLAASFVLTPFYLSSVGKPLFGLWIVAQQLLLYVQLTDLGLSGIVAREIAYATGRRRSSSPGQNVQKILAISARLSFAQIPLFLGAAYLLLFLLPEEWNALTQPMGWTLLGYAFLFPFRIAPTCLQGLQDLAFVAGLTLTAWILATTLTVTWIVLEPGIAPFFAGWLAIQGIQIVGSSFRLVFVHREYMGFFRESVSLSEMGVQAKKSLWVSASQLSQLFLNSTDSTIVGRAMSGGAAVTFALTSRLSTTLGHNPRILMETARPGLSEVMMEGDAQRTVRVSNMLTTLMAWMSGLIFAVVFFVNQGFIEWWVGADNFAGQWFTFLILANMMVRHWHSSLVMNAFCFGKEKPLTFVGIADGVCTLVLSIVLVNSMGMIGIPIAALTSASIIGVPPTLYLISKTLKVSVGNLILPFLPLVSMTGLTIGILAIVRNFWMPQALWEIGLGSLGAAVLFVALTWVPLQRTRVLDYLWPLLAHRRRSSDDRRAA